jgi:hypothetical protein
MDMDRTIGAGLCADKAAAPDINRADKTKYFFTDTPPNRVQPALFWQMTFL